MSEMLLEVNYTTVQGRQKKGDNRTKRIGNSGNSK